MDDRGRDSSKAGPSPADVLAQLERMLRAKPLHGAPRLTQLLRFLVEEAQAGRTSTLSQYGIARSIFRRPESFDPQTDPVVRVQAGRLRRAIDDYYRQVGSQDRVRIDVPKGTYDPAFSWWVAGQPQAPAESGAAAAGVSGLPRIGVLPFRDRSSTEDDIDLAYGLGEEITIALSRFANLEVLAHGSLLGYAETAPNIRTVGAELGATLLLLGSVYRNRDRLRVNLHLHDVATGVQLWGDLYDHTASTAGLLDAQDVIVHRVAATLADDYGVIPRATMKAARVKRFTDFSAYEAVLQCHQYAQTLNHERYEGSTRALEHAVRVEPEFAMAWALLGQVYLDGNVFGFSSDDGLPAKGRECVLRALRLDPACQHAHYVRAYVGLVERDRTSMRKAADRVLAINPHSAFLVSCAGFFLTLAGEFKRGLEVMASVRDLNPDPPQWFHFAPFLAHFTAGDYEEALASARRFGSNDFFWGPLIRAAALARLGRYDEASVERERLLILRPDFPERASEYVSAFVLDDEIADRIVTAQRDAGRGTASATRV